MNQPLLDLQAESLAALIYGPDVLDRYQKDVAVVVARGEEPPTMSQWLIQKRKVQP